MPDQEPTIKSRGQTMHRYLGVYPGGNGMCVSGFVPGFIVDGLIGCQPPPLVGLSNLQYPSG
jgi:hypothetical protein